MRVSALPKPLATLRLSEQMKTPGRPSHGWPTYITMKASWSQFFSSCDAYPNAIQPGRPYLNAVLTRWLDESPHAREGLLRRRVPPPLPVLVARVRPVQARSKRVPLLVAHAADSAAARRPPAWAR